ncbi:hypothetical protein [Herbiconiux ginsengi]|uniref:Uncharacterized protein n=1 Tax=Herbiconiux ginsengi TaxID=381665 RepID=A0A1H3U1V8_9MICO|nr:hypothetical protein [Herbiconiux ginsengi]SDZ56423.1 hypothetical protein SAMN05216554_0029 [Herbiconiux ginsengi]
MEKTRWTACALRARLRAEQSLDAGGAAQRALALKRLELLKIIRQVDTNAITAELATDQLNALTDTIHTIRQLPPEATMPLFQRAR